MVSSRIIPSPHNTVYMHVGIDGYSNQSLIHILLFSDLLLNLFLFFMGLGLSCCLVFGIKF